jgi:SOS-response transcriptional repressor LexA
MHDETTTQENQKISLPLLEFLQSLAVVSNRHQPETNGVCPQCAGGVKIKNPSQVRLDVHGQDLDKFGIKDGDLIVFDFNAGICEGAFVIAEINNDFRVFRVESVNEKTVCLFNGRRRKFKRSEINLLGRVIRLERNL